MRIEEVTTKASAKLVRWKSCVALNVTPNDRAARPSYNAASTHFGLQPTAAFPRPDVPPEKKPCRIPTAIVPAPAAAIQVVPLQAQPVAPPTWRSKTAKKYKNVQSSYSQKAMNKPKQKKAQPLTAEQAAVVNTDFIGLAQDLLRLPWKGGIHPDDVKFRLSELESMVKALTTARDKAWAIVQDPVSHGNANKVIDALGFRIDAIKEGHTKYKSRRFKDDKNSLKIDGILNTFVHAARFDEWNIPTTEIVARWNEVEAYIDILAQLITEHPEERNYIGLTRIFRDKLPLINHRYEKALAAGIIDLDGHATEEYTDEAARLADAQAKKVYRAARDKGADKNWPVNADGAAEFRDDAAEYTDDATAEYTDDAAEFTDDAGVEYTADEAAEFTDDAEYTDDLSDSRTDHVNDEAEITDDLSVYTCGYGSERPDSRADYADDEAEFTEDGSGYTYAGAENTEEVEEDTVEEAEDAEEVEEDTVEEAECAEEVEEDTVEEAECAEEVEEDTVEEAECAEEVEEDTVEEAECAEEVEEDTVEEAECADDGSEDSDRVAQYSDAVSREKFSQIENPTFSDKKKFKEKLAAIKCVIMALPEEDDD